MSELDQREGMGAAVAAVLAFVFALGGAVGFGIGRGCSVGAPPVSSRSELPREAIAPVKETAAASSSASSISKTASDLRITVKGRKPTAQAPAGRESGATPVQADLRESTPPSRGSGEVSGGFEEFEIIVESSQSISSGATAGSNAVIERVSADQGDHGNHGRVGAIVGTFPGALALDASLLRFEIPRGVFNADLEVSLGVEANLEQVGATATVGSKFFAGGVAWSRWSLAGQGLGVAIGMRF